MDLPFNFVENRKNKINVFIVLYFWKSITVAECCCFHSRALIKHGCFDSFYGRREVNNEGTMKSSHTPAKSYRRHM